MGESEVEDRLASSVEAAELEIPQSDREEFFDLIFDAIGEQLRERGEATVPGLGTFEVRHREERSGENPREDEEGPIWVEPFVDVDFTPADGLEEDLAGD